MTERFVMPEYVRAAIIAQGKVDPDEIEKAAATVDMTAEWEAETAAEQLRLAVEQERRSADPAGEREQPWWEV